MTLARSQDLNYTDSQMASGTPILPAPILTTRYADREDLAEVLEMYLSALNEIRDYILKPSPAKCAREVLASWATAPCILLEKAGKIIGFAGFKVNSPTYSEEKAISDYMFYIKPEFRSVKHAKALSDAAKSMADALKMPLTMVHMTFGRDTDTKAEFLQRWGYKPVGVVVGYGG